MSFSFTARGSDKAAAKAAVAAELAKVIACQAPHERDVKAAQATADTYIDMLDDKPEMDIRVDGNGSLSWTGQFPDAVFTGASIGISAYYVSRT